MRACTYLFVAAALGIVPAAGASKPPPPPDWDSTYNLSRLLPGRTATFWYSVDSADAVDVHVTLTTLPPALRLLDAGTTPYRRVAGKPTWTLSLPGGHSAVRGLRFRVRVSSRSRRGDLPCFTLRQSATSGGKPDVIPLRLCYRVQ
jgi:hypothetical protein